MAKVITAITIGMVLFWTSSMYAQRQIESLDRGVVAVDLGEGKVYVGWRMLGTDPNNIAFNVYRDNTCVNDELITDSTNIVDSDGIEGAVYTVRAVVNGLEGRPSTPAKAWNQNYLSIPLQTPDGFSPNDASVGDLDGDGEYEIVLHEVGRGRDNAQAGVTTEPILEAYKLDGTFLWRINLGKNIREGAHYTQFMVYDLNGDGRAEVACKTADGTIDGKGRVIGDPNANYVNERGYILDGPEFLTIFDGQTGATLVTTDYIPPRGNVADWGDNNGNRVDRFLACIAYLDGQRPSLIMCRGYYTRAVLAAWNWRDGKFTHVWTFDSDDGTPGNEAYRGQGNHSLSVADVDGDGKDEIVYGVCVIDHDGKGLYSSGLNHGDAMHLSDLDPNRPGLELFQPHERASDTAGISFTDAKTGELIWGKSSTGDVGRGMAADIDPRYPGCECWASGGGAAGLFNCKGEMISETKPRSCNFGIWWDGDLLRELLDRNRITKWDWENGVEVTLFTAEGCSSNNGSKTTPALSADLFGDWREEVVFRTTDNKSLRIYTTTILTNHRLYTLMHDTQYRMSIAWQNVAYNQPPHVGFYLGEGIAPPPRPNIELIQGSEIGVHGSGNIIPIPGPRIDRKALVTRHNVTIKKADPLTPLSAGNGQFAITCDITGLQTFPDYYEKGMPLGTQSQWGWHTLPNPKNYKLEDILEEYEVAGRKVPYASDRQYSKDYSPAASWLRANPHRLHLGQIGLSITKSDGLPVKIEDFVNTSQTLDLWTGLLSSQFEFQEHPFKVLTVCHPARDILAVRIETDYKGLAVSLAFPYGSSEWRNAADWNHPERHTTQLQIAEEPAVKPQAKSAQADKYLAPRFTRGFQADFIRILDADRYYVRAICSEGSEIRTKSQHEYEFCSAEDSLEIVFTFSPMPIKEPLPTFENVRTAAAEYWQQFWQSGGAIDFSQCTDPRAFELERRVVLSQYLTAIQCCGTLPPQETGLVCNSWFGKFHLEMHWWHAVHFALWGRIELLERSLPWYQSILPKAKAAAELQGYRGARWPKMTCPDGSDSPSQVGVFLIWQQAHPIYYAELCYRAHPDRKTLERYRDIVFQTADFMASYPIWDESQKRYVLGPALIPAQESYGRYRMSNLNPTFELAYWYWALETAQKWRLRLGLERNPNWDKVIQNLSLPNIREGVYTGIETPPYTINEDHPSMLAALGFVPQTPLIDPNTMKRTLDYVTKSWDWPSTWGWDYPMMAMTAARLGEKEKAVDALFSEAEKNRYLANGHNFQSARLPLYLPGNGGLLAAVAMMAAGWDDCGDSYAPGFPNNGKWNIRWEGLKRMP